MSLKLTLDFQYTTTIEKLWSALTESGKLAKWVMSNDFKAEVGTVFSFVRSQMSGGMASLPVKC